MTDTKKADKFFQANNHDLQTIFAKIKLLEELNTKVSALLDERLKESCQVANLVGNRLILIAANGSAATQLRFLTPDLLKKFKLDPVLKKIQDIQCKVRPPQSTLRTNQPVKKMQPLSHETAHMIREIADSMDDPKLKEVLMRIAEHTK